MNAVLILATAYLLGSVPFGYILVRVFRHQDIRASGSGNIGATNVLRSGAKGLGIATLFLDTLKGVAAVLLARHFLPGNLAIWSLAALAAIVGHVFPVWLGFRGGKGVATALGVFLALSWPTAVCALAIFIVVVVLTRYVSLASVIASIALPFFFLYFVPQHPWITRTNAMTVASVFLCAAIVIAKHHANIMRLRSGTESRFGRQTDAGAKR